MIMLNDFYLKGFLTFLKIGFFTIGGGYAMIPLIEKEVVDKHRWVEREEFLDMMALSQAMPGVFAVNFSICIGNRLRGFKGSVALASGVILPSLVVILLVAMFFGMFSDNRVVEAIFKGIRAAAAKVKFANAWLPMVVALLIALAGISPVYVIVLVAVGAYLYGRYIKED
mgnify:CR=1 FL=1